MITYIIIAITVLVSIAGFQRTEVFNKYLFNPYTIRRHNEWWRFFTHAFIHADFVHLAMNMYVLYGFGRYIEMAFDVYFDKLAVLYYLLLYIGGIFLSAVPSFEKHKDHSYYTAVGASGAVSAIVFSFILIQPLAGMGLLFVPFRIPAVIFGTLYLLYSSYMAKRGNDNIGHDAHFWGAIFGLLFTAILKPALVPAFIEQVKQLIPY